MKNILPVLLLLTFAGAVHAQELEPVRGYYVTAGATQMTGNGDTSINGFTFGAGKDLFATPHLRGGFQFDSHVYRNSGATTHQTTILLTLRGIVGSAMVRPYGEVGYGYVTARQSETLPVGTEISFGLEFQAGAQSAYLGYTATQGEEPMHSLKLGVRIP